MSARQVRRSPKLTPDFSIDTGPVSVIAYYVQFYASAVDTNITASVLTSWNMAATSLTLATNIIGTALIIIRIVRVTGVGSRTYAGIIEILVESSLLYSFTNLVYLALYVHDIYASYVSDANYYPQAMLDTVTVSYLTLGIDVLLTLCLSVYCSCLDHSTCRIRESASKRFMEKQLAYWRLAKRTSRRTIIVALPVCRAHRRIRP